MSDRVHSIPGVKVKAHPTNYAGTRFRSRLEARWAAFFDLAKWKWEYEPVDEENWTPDFLIRGWLGTIAVEVKPIEWPTYDAGCLIDYVRSGHGLDKVRKSGRHEALVLGAYPIGWAGDSMWAPGLGIFIRGEIREESDIAVLCQSDTRAFELLPMGDTYGFLIECGGKSPGLAVGWDEVELAWREAGNRVQWRGSHSRETLDDD